MITRSLHVGTKVYIFFLTATSVVGMFLYVRLIDNPGQVSDAYSHLLNSRMLFDSLTPGLSQLGFWPPLLHIALLPVTVVDLFFYADLSIFVQIPFLFFAAWYLFCFLQDLTKGVLLPYVGTILFLLNPFILFYATGALTEIPTFTFLFATIYYFNRWIKEQKVAYVTYAGVCISLVFLSRYEGMVLVPVCTILVFGISLYSSREWSKAIATTLLFLSTAMLGIVAVLLYGVYYGGDALAFLSIGVRSTGDIAIENTRTTIVDWFMIKEDAVRDFTVMVLAARALVADWVCIFGSLAFVLCTVLYRKRIDVISVLMIIVSPSIFIFLMTLLGNNHIEVPGYPFDRYNNTRYALTLLGVFIVSLVLLIAWVRQHGAWFGRMIGVLCSILLLYSSALFLYDTILVSRLDVIRRDISHIPYVGRISKLDELYDYGLILSIRYYQEVRIMQSYVPYNRYIQEGTYKNMLQALKEPWIFARWVIINETDFGQAKGPEIAALRRIEQSEQFKRYYTLLLPGGFRIYRLNENLLRTNALSLGYDLSTIPSLNSDIEWWDPEMVYTNIRSSIQE